MKNSFLLLFGSLVWLACPCAGFFVQFNDAEDDLIVEEDHRPDEANLSMTFSDDDAVDDMARIVGGYQPDRDRYPYFVRVDFNSQLHCGGVLISPQVVLTAAHCVRSDSGYYTAYVNAYNTFSSYSGTQVKGVSQAYRHPSYTSSSRQYDAGVLLLASPVTNPRTTTLNDNPNEPGLNDPLTIIGVGDSREGGSSTVWLNQATVYPVAFSTCNSNYGGSVDDRTMFCARNGGTDTCQGDSGGPILQTINGVEQVVGITSWGQGCAQPRYPGVYARASAVKPWVDYMLQQWGAASAPQIPIASPQPPPQQASYNSNTDGCSDDPIGTFYISLVGSVGCSWLRRNPIWKRSFCRQGSRAYDLCGQTCNNCRDAGLEPESPYPTPSPTPEPTPVPTPSPTPFPTPDPTALIDQASALQIPTSDSAIPYRADCDDKEDQFFVNDQEGYQRCVWLRDRPEWQGTLCVPGQEAYTVCEETCGACRDNCEDSKKEKFWLQGVQRDCLWLSLRPELHSQLCSDSYDAYKVCPETCERCDVEVCDDSRRGRFFVNDELGEMPCVWLKARPEWQDRLCVSDSDASKLCPETCGVCHDDCEDGPEKIVVDGKEQNCLWLSLRPNVQDEVCPTDESIRSICRETCNTCNLG